jgi:hypothetical protein
MFMKRIPEDKKIVVHFSYSMDIELFTDSLDEHYGYL